MNLLLFRHQHARFDTPDQRSGLVEIDGRQLTHLQEVHQAGEGDRVRVGILDGWRGDARVERLAETALLRFELTEPPPAPSPVTLCLALPRPKMVRRLLQCAASAGIKDIYLLNSARVEKSYWQSPHLGEAAILENLWLGLEQARDTVLPRVHLRKRFRPFVEDELPALVAGCQGLLAHPAPDSMPCPRAVTTPTVLAVGPEGGFVPFEVDLLRIAGMTPVTLGERILRVDVAVPWLLGRLC
jgi:16S rRNA (uracil1498-N3)-methyltransferase